jgi:exodeoxyribonuclease X
MATDSDQQTRFRVLDVETTGLQPSDAVVEIGAVDLIGDEVVIIGSDLIRPPFPIPPAASAIHHITDDDVGGCGPLEEHLSFYLDQTGEAGVDVFASHNWKFDAQWLGDRLGGHPVICTYKCALRVWPEAPAHNNQALRYWLKPEGLDPTVANMAHRALPDAYVTAFILRELLKTARVEDLIAWTEEPALPPRIPFGRYRGRSWADVPQNYLAWIIERSDLGEDIRFTAAYHRCRRLGGEAGQIRPMSNRISRITTIRPTPPLGA